MKRSRYSEEQVVGILREAQGGMTTKAVCAGSKDCHPRLLTDQ